jgi:hypothetical protein
VLSSTRAFTSNGIGFAYPSRRCRTAGRRHGASI